MRGIWTLAAAAAMGFTAAAQTVQVQSATPADFPALVDSNSPSYWSNGTLYLYNSINLPIRSESGTNASFGRARAVFVQGANHWRWIESAWQDADGTVYAWYHAEPLNVCPGQPLTAPQIGALVSSDGVNFRDLGIVLRSGDLPNCATNNNYFAGGHGDFAVIPDRQTSYFYFLFTNYGGDVNSQGIAVARVAYADLASPVRHVWKFYDGNWTEPGLGGRLTPVFAARADWASAAPDSFWGPAVHWNTVLGQYVVLMNHAVDRIWSQEGIYISFCPDISNPAAWTMPSKMMDGQYGWYPELVGDAPGDTDTLVGASARLYIMGHSEWQVTFSPQPSDPVPSAPLNGTNQVRGGRFSRRDAPVPHH